MASKRAATEAGACPGAPGTIHSLSNEQLLQILNALKLQERCRGAALVCRRWGRLSASPQLLRSVAATLSGSKAVARAQSFKLWLARHGRSVQELEVVLRPWYYRQRASGAEMPAGGEGVAIVFLPTEDAKQLLTELLLGVIACGKAGSLAELRLMTDSMPNFHMPPSVVRGLRGVRRLQLSCGQSRLTLACRLSPMTSLQSLALNASPLRIQPGADLGVPAGLTSLALGGLPERGLPPQVTRLTRLRRLQLVGASCGPQGFQLLPQLAGSLERLVLQYLSSLPPASAVAPLSSLRTLHLRDSVRRSTVEAASGLLAAAPQLTELALAYSSASEAAPLPATGLACLSRLEAFSLGWEAAAAASEGPELPQGPWLGSLQRMQAPAGMLEASVDALQAGASKLKCLAIPGLDPGRPQHQQLLQRLAAALPALQRVCTDAPPTEGWEDALEGARLLRPGLSLVSVTDLPAEVLSEDP